MGDQSVHPPVGAGMGVVPLQVASADASRGVPAPQSAHGGCDDQVLDVPDGEFARAGGVAGSELTVMSGFQQRLSPRKKGPARFGESAALGRAVEQAPPDVARGAGFDGSAQL
ncbi:hypothetical protein C5E45_22200 [Nocardia nova]|uniref:Uncharacterized protein n=1 Tax=Nocardia nova TaxID=37330 RepID=A0A2S6ALN7_9NOCA|nr:hypothetical protein C5E41_16835 [Nocardia nova]PPJ36113.1 hypothetical protein C5E45_22200 [Nocardia nova]